jgi:hypothetical protein
MPVARLRRPTLLDWWHFLRPPLIGAAFLASYVALRIFAFASAGRFADNGDDATNALSFAAASGAMCGLAYSLIGRPLRKRGAVGNYLAGIVCVIPYFVFLFFFGPVPSERADYHDPFWWGGVLVASVFVGVFLGREFHEKDNLFKPDSDEAAT